MVTAGVLNRTLAFAASLTLRMVASLPLYAAMAPMLSDVPVIVQLLTPVSYTHLTLPTKA